MYPCETEIWRLESRAPRRLQPATRRRLPETAAGRSRQDLRDRRDAIDETLGRDFHFLEHGEHQVAEACFLIFRAAAEVEPFIVIEFVVAAFGHVVVDVLAVLEAEPPTT